MIPIATWAAHHRIVNAPVSYPTSLRGYWPPTADLKDQISGESGSIGGATLVTDSGASQGYAIQSDGFGIARLPSAGLNSWTTRISFSVSCRIYLPAVPTAFQVFISTRASLTSKGFDIRNAPPGARDQWYFRASAGTGDDVMVTFSTNISSGAFHACFTYSPTIGAETGICDLYINGVSVEQATGYSELVNVSNASDLSVCGRNDYSGQLVNGARVSDIEYHDVKLDAEGVSAAYARSQP